MNVSAIQAPRFKANHFFPKKDLTEDDIRVLDAVWEIMPVAEADEFMGPSNVIGKSDIGQKRLVEGPAGISYLVYTSKPEQIGKTFGNHDIRLAATVRALFSKAGRETIPYILDAAHQYRPSQAHQLFQLPYLLSHKSDEFTG